MRTGTTTRRGRGREGRGGRKKVGTMYLLSIPLFAADQLANENNGRRVISLVRLTQNFYQSCFFFFGLNIHSFFQEI